MRTRMRPCDAPSIGAYACSHGHSPIRMDARMRMDVWRVLPSEERVGKPSNRPGDCINPGPRSISGVERFAGWVERSGPGRSPAGPSGELPLLVGASDLHVRGRAKPAAKTPHPPRLV